MIIEKIKSDFVAQAAEHYSATLEGDYKKANKIHKKLMKLYQKANNIDEKNIFLEFLDAPNEGVRLWAATFSLKSNSELAVNCLNNLVELPTIVSMDAKMILGLWEKGELELL